MEKGHSNLYKNEPVCICKEDWWVGLGQGEGCLCEGRGNCLKCLKMDGKKEGKENTDFKNGGQAGSRRGCLKRVGPEPTYKLCPCV